MEWKREYKSNQNRQGRINETTFTAVRDLSIIIALATPMEVNLNDKWREERERGWTKGGQTIAALSGILLNRKSDQMVKILAISIQLARVIPFYYRKLAACCPSCDQPRHAAGIDRGRKTHGSGRSPLLVRGAERRRVREKGRNEENEGIRVARTRMHAYTRIDGETDKVRSRGEEP